MEEDAVIPVKILEAFRIIKLCSSRGRRPRLARHSLESLEYAQDFHLPLMSLSNQTNGATEGPASVRPATTLNIYQPPPVRWRGFCFCQINIGGRETRAVVLAQKNRGGGLLLHHGVTFYFKLPCRVFAPGASTVTRPSGATPQEGARPFGSSCGIHWFVQALSGVWL